MTDRDILLRLIASLTLCESEGDVAEAVAEALHLAEIEVEWEDLHDLNLRLDEAGIQGLWGEEVGD